MSYAGQTHKVDAVCKWVDDGTAGGSGYVGEDNGGQSSDVFVSNPGNVAPGGQDASQKKPCTGNPIIPSTGNKIEPETDFVSTGEMPLFLKRTYNRYWGEKGLFGYFWLSNFDLRIKNIVDQQMIVAYRSDGRKVNYLYNALPSPAWYENKAEPVSRIVADWAA